MRVGLILFAVGICAAVPSTDQKTEDGHLILENPEIVPGLFEGDIELYPGENPTLRNAVGDKSRVWPHGIIPYHISSVYPETVKRTMKAAMAEIESKTKVNGKTCVHFKERTTENAYYYFYKGDGCQTHAGYTGGRVTVTIGNGCESKGTLMHEIMHGLGFWHEQSRTDRDSYITVHYDNINDDDIPQFKKFYPPKIDMLHTPYDYGSIMHYGQFYFSKDRSKPTITPKQRGVTIGQRVALSPIDIHEIQILYGCKPRPNGTPHVINPPSHHTSAPHSGSGDLCTFDSGLCGWTNTNADQTDWQRHHGGTPSNHTGPSLDHHGSSSGSYLYIETSGHANQAAKLESKPYHGGVYCVDFYYHMYGADTGSLNLNVVTSSGVHRVKTFSGDGGNRWHLQRVHVNVPTSQSFRFLFAGHVGSGSKCDIAIDDISITSGSC